MAVHDCSNLENRRGNSAVVHTRTQHLTLGPDFFFIFCSQRSGSETERNGVTAGPGGHLVNVTHRPDARPSFLLLFSSREQLFLQFLTHINLQKLKPQIRVRCRLQGCVSSVCFIYLFFLLSSSSPIFILLTIAAFVPAADRCIITQTASSV